MPKVKQLSERAWVRQVMRGYEELHDQKPLSGWELDEQPDWVFRAMIPLMGISHPKLTRIPLRKWTAKDLGYFLGRQSALERVMWGEVPMSRELIKETKRSAETQLRLMGVDSADRIKKKAGQVLGGLAKWRLRFQKFINAVLLNARRRPYGESAAFMKGFSEGNTVSDDDFDSRKIGVSEKIAWVMFLFWRHIEKFESVAEVHRFLAAAAKPMNIQISLKRVEGLCRRIKLRFKGRGRPKKKKPTGTPRHS